MERGIERTERTKQLGSRGASHPEQQYSHLRQCGNEPAFTGEVTVHEKAGRGMVRLVVRGTAGRELFLVRHHKYDIEIGWRAYRTHRGGDEGSRSGLRGRTPASTG